MKTIYLVRHAKSSWKDQSLSDRDRPLNKRGLRDAPRMASFLNERITTPDVFISSTSRRTQDTAVYFLSAFQKKDTDLILEEALYHGYEDDFEEVIQQLDNKIDSAMLFVHNPGITDYVNQLTGQDIYNIPTCGIAGIKFDIMEWSKWHETEGELLFYYYPKGLDLHSD